MEIRKGERLQGAVIVITKNLSEDSVSTSNKRVLNAKSPGNSLAVQCLGLCASTDAGPDSVLDQGTKIPQVCSVAKKKKPPRAFFSPQIFELHCAKIDVLPLVTEHKVQSSSGHLVKRPTHLSLELESANLSAKGQIVIILGFLGHIWSRSHILFYFIFFNRYRM